MRWVGADHRSCSSGLVPGEEVFGFYHSHLDKPPVEGAAPQQFVVGAFGGDPSPVEQQDTVGPDDRRGSVCDDHDGAPPEDLANGLLWRPLVPGVELGCALVEKEQPGPVWKPPGQACILARSSTPSPLRARRPRRPGWRRAGSSVFDRAAGKVRTSCDGNRPYGAV
jgi:hypothetical protein